MTIPHTYHVRRITFIVAVVPFVLFALFRLAATLAFAFGDPLINDRWLNLFSDSPAWFACGVAVWFVIVVIWVAQLAHRRFGAASVFGLVLAGAASNLFDRFRWGGVVDYFHVGTLPVFNAADLAIVSGIVLFIARPLVRGR